MILVDKHWTKVCEETYENKEVRFMKTIRTEYSIDILNAIKNASVRMNESHVSIEKEKNNSYTVNVDTSSKIPIQIRVRYSIIQGINYYIISGSYSIKNNNDICKILEYFPKFQSCAGYIISESCKLLREKRNMING